jgi:diguanylate cyclase (GGDEF)-like protein
MDERTLAVSNLLFLLLYAAITFMYRTTYRDLQPGVRGSDWFIASNLLGAFAVGATLFAGSLRQRIVSPVGLLAIVVCHLLLHRAFAELLDRGLELWRTQLGLLAAALAIWVYVTISPRQHGASMLLEMMMGVQYCVTGFMLFHRSLTAGRLAGWLAGGVTTAYGLCHIACCSLGLMGRGWSSGRVPMMVVLVARGAIAFAFLLVAASRLRMQLEREAGVDELTGLMNRRAVRRAATLSLARCRRKSGLLSVLMFDLDGLKYANDQLGHGAGDALLTAVAGELRVMLREHDRLARVGGDEFCLLLPGADEAEAVRVAERCRRTLQAMVVSYDGNKLQVRASFGVAHSADCAMSWDELLRRSDAAMYRAKREGGNRVAVGEDVEVASIFSVEEFDERLLSAGSI